MSGNYGFDKNEGFIGSVDDFNGIIFFLRESNTNSQEVNEFWFQRVINEGEQYFQELMARGDKRATLSKRTATRFTNEFQGVLARVELDMCLSNIAFCNVNSRGGNKSMGEDYKEALKNAHNKLEKIVLQSPQRQLHIFTCIDIYEKIKQEWNIKHTLTEQDGIQYVRKKKEGAASSVTKKCFKCQIEDKHVTVYAIFHPSRRSGYKLL